MRLFVLFLWIAVSALSTAHADWPHLRGPNYDGVSAETGLAAIWPEGGPPRLWARELGQGYSGFIVADGKLYTQRQTLSGQSILCLNPDDGEILWEYRYDWAWQPRGAYPGPYASPTWYRGKVFWASTSGLVGCVDGRTGEPQWSLNLRDRFKGKGWGFGYAGTPLVEDDKIILPVGGPGGSLVALHVDDGRTLWSTGADPASYCPAFPLTFQGRRCVVGYLQNAVILVEMATGKLLHRQPLSDGYDEHSAWPVYREPHLMLASPFKVPAVQYEFQAGDGNKLNCKTQWLCKDLCNDVVSSVLYQDHLYGFDLKQLQASPRRSSRGAFNCVAWSSGKVRWSTDEIGHASVLVADDKLILFNDTGSLILARADPEAYHELGRTYLFPDEICWTPPTLWRNKLFVRSPSQMICLFIGKTDQPGSPSPTSVLPASSSRFWSINPNWLLSREREFPNDAPSWQEMGLWFGASLIFAFVGAALATLLFLFLAKRLFGRCLSFTWFFLGCTFLLGLLGPNVFSSLADDCLFTWPASLYAAFHATLIFCSQAEDSKSQRRDRWLARLSVLGFLLVCWGYFELCKSVGMFIVWSFLVGFPCAFPFTYLAVLARKKQQPVWIRAAWTLLGFAVFFWSCQGLLLWKNAVAD